MFLKEFNQTPTTKLNILNKMLNEQFGINIRAGFPTRKKLNALLESANMAILKLRNSNKKFQLEPEYAKFLGIRDAVETMISEGMYAESQRCREMRTMLSDSVCSLMDSGYSLDEAVAECMNRYRMNPELAFPDEYVLPMVLTAAKSYMKQCESMNSATVFPSTDLNHILLRELAREYGIKLTDSNCYEQIEETLDSFAEASGRSKPAVVGFLNGLDEAALLPAIRMFGTMLAAEGNQFTGARVDAIRAGKKQFTVGGKSHPVIGDTTDERLNETSYGSSGNWIYGSDDDSGPDKARARLWYISRKDADGYSYTLHPSGRPPSGAQQDGNANEFVKTLPANTTVKKFSAREYAQYGTPAKDIKLSDVPPPSQQQKMKGGELMDNATFRRKVQSPVTEMSMPTTVINHKQSYAMFDHILNDLLMEEVDVEQAEVVMAVRSLADDVQDQVERIGRMMNEDLPAILDKMRAEMGVQAAQTFADNVNQLLAAHLEATKAVKAGMDQSVGMITGEDMLDMQADTDGLDQFDAATEPTEQQPEMDIEGEPENAPLGRAEV
jgi:hypothetical protein